MVSTKFFFQGPKLNIIFQFLDYKKLLFFLRSDFGQLLRNVFKKFLIIRYFRRQKMEIRTRQQRYEVFYRDKKKQVVNVLKEQYGYNFLWKKKKKHNKKDYALLRYSIKQKYFVYHKYTYSKKERKKGVFLTMDNIIMEVTPPIEIEDNGLDDLGFFSFFNGAAHTEERNKFHDFCNDFWDNHYKPLTLKEDEVFHTLHKCMLSPSFPYLIENYGIIKRQTDLERILEDLDYPELNKNFVPKYKFD